MRKEYIDSIESSFEDSYDKLISLLNDNVLNHEILPTIVSWLDVTIKWAQILTGANTYDQFMEGLENE